MAMNPSHDIVAGGGGRLRQYHVRVKAVIAGSLALFWITFWIVGLKLGSEALIAFIISGWRGWLFGLALLVHPVLISAAILFFRTEKPRLIEFWIPRNLDPSDWRKLFSTRG
jgi:hypothetical protein